MKLLKVIWSLWVRIAHKIGIIQSKIILTIFYFTLLAPIGILFSFFKDELGIKNNTNSTFINRNKKEITLESLKQQY